MQKDEVACVYAALALQVSRDFFNVWFNVFKITFWAKFGSVFSQNTKRKRDLLFVSNSDDCTEIAESYCNCLFWTYVRSFSFYSFPSKTGNSAMPCRYKSHICGGGGARVSPSQLVFFCQKLQIFTADILTFLGRRCWGDGTEIGRSSEGGQGGRGPSLAETLLQGSPGRRCRCQFFYIFSLQKFQVLLL